MAMACSPSLWFKTPLKSHANPHPVPKGPLACTLLLTGADSAVAWGAAFLDGAPAYWVLLIDADWAALTGLLLDGAPASWSLLACSQALTGLLLDGVPASWSLLACSQALTGLLPGVQPLLDGVEANYRFWKAEQQQQQQQQQQQRE
eukprot:1159363-Pelagomonas_calceolata.AAC.13